MAEKTWRAAERRGPSERLVHANLGLLYERAGDTPRAAEQFRRELEVNPRDYAAHIRLGAILYRNGTVPAALALWDEARGLRPRDPSAYTMLLRHFLEVGDRDGAAAMLRLAREHRVALPRDLLEALGGAGA
jgi:Flp pilus assembly protein TadD